VTHETVTTLPQTIRDAYLVDPTGVTE